MEKVITTYDGSLASHDDGVYRDNQTYIFLAFT